MRLPDFIRQNKLSIIEEWERFAQTLTPAAHMTRWQLRDHIEQILVFIADDIQSRQTASQQVKKSHGESDRPEEGKDSAAQIHGALRQEAGFDIVQMVSEYRALRGSVIKLWMQAQSVLAEADLVDLTRFNESIDQALAESVVRFMAKVDYSKDLLLGILGHDIRSPLGAIKMSATLLPRLGSLNEKQAELALQIEQSSSRINDIVGNLLDLTQARLGSGLPAVKAPMDMGELVQQIVAETQSRHPTRNVLLDVTGNVTGEWDVTRMGQLLSNLLNNAVQYGKKNSPIRVTLKGDPGEITLSVHNRCDPIPPLQLETLFESFTRGEKHRSEIGEVSSNLGLGLFITREIVTSHDGSIGVTSNEKEGTIFFVRLPK